MNAITGPAFVWVATIMFTISAVSSKKFGPGEIFVIALAITGWWTILV